MRCGSSCASAVTVATVCSRSAVPGARRGERARERLGYVDCQWVLIWHRDTDLSTYDAVIIPGGFSYGDYLRAGALARFSPVMNSVKKFADSGRLRCWVRMVARMRSAN